MAIIFGDCNAAKKFFLHTCLVSLHSSLASSSNGAPDVAPHEDEELILKCQEQQICRPNVLHIKRRTISNHFYLNSKIHCKNTSDCPVACSNNRSSKASRKTNLNFFQKLKQ